MSDASISPAVASNGYPREQEASGADGKIVWIVITAYREAQTVGQVVRDSLLQSPYVLVVDDGSDDETAQRALEAGAHVVRHVFNLGQGAALQTGITFALSEGAELIVTMDADGQHDPSDIATMVAELEAAGADVALGDRFSGRAIGISWRRRLILKCAWFLIRLTSGRAISDSQIGLRLFSAEAARKLTITQNRMAYASELINQITRLNLKIIEIPVSVTYTSYSIRKGQSGFNSINILIDLIVGRLVK